MVLNQECDACGGKSSLAARYCQWCGRRLRDLEPFEEPYGESTENNQLSP